MSNDVLDVSKVLSEEDLKYYGELAKESNDGSGNRAPTLKINYDDDSKYPKGTWVIGQLKDQTGKIIDQGKKVNNLVVLKIRNMYSLWDQEDATKNCKSPMFRDGEKVKGNNYHYQCGKTCPLKVEGKCKAMKVVFGVAITESNETIDCVSYMKGVNYMPFKNYIDEAIVLKVGEKNYNIPVYSFVTKLDSEKGVKGSVKFYTAVFKRIQIMKKTATDALKVKADKLEKSLDNFEAYDSETTDKDEPISVTPSAVVHEDMMNNSSEVVENKDVIDISAASPGYEDLFGETK